MIVFVDYLYKEIGGVGQLVVNTVLALNQRNEIAKIYCSGDSYEYKQLKSLGASFTFINSDEVSLKQLPDFLDNTDVILLTHINNTPLLEQLKNKGIRILFYSVHPDTFFVYNRYMKVFAQKSAALQLVSLLLSKKALVFMDTPNVEGVNRRGGKLCTKEMEYLPIPIHSTKKISRIMHQPNGISITYIGRGNADWKVYPIVRVVKDLQKIAKDITLTIITDKTELFEAMIKKAVPENHLNITYKTGLSGESLSNYLAENSDLHISMGTSALEGARLGVPTILIDYSYNQFPDNYLYRWLFECKGFCLAEDITNVSSFEGYTIDEIINSISDSSKYMELSLACYDYVQKNHSADNYIIKLIDYCENTHMTVNDYCRTRFSFNMKWVNSVVVKLSNYKNKLLRKNS